MDLILMESISRFRLELEQIEREIRRFERLYDLHRRHPTATRDRNRGKTAGHSPSLATCPAVLTQSEKQSHPASDHAFELGGTLLYEYSRNPRTTPKSSVPRPANTYMDLRRKIEQRVKRRANEQSPGTGSTESDALLQTQRTL
jgi:hypothetical protein